VLADLLRTPTLLARLGAGAREHAMRFSWDRTAEGLRAAYVEAIDELAARRVAAR
jgi:D-inositol-3-phosphate glycosyltransferase